ncbi:MAG TPA: hypothetical protein VES39_08495 [Rhodospirillales bacterium]|nr:hypothetical protein [Rhodospirillales bacterium]
MSERAHKRRFPRQGFERLVRSAVGGLILRPWFDDAALRLLTQWYFPLSRGWAAALAANGSPDCFAAAIPCGRLARRLLPGILKRAQARQTALDAADDAWEDSFFGDGPARGDVEAERLSAAGALTNLRSAFVPLHLQSALPAVAWEIESPASVAHRHGARLAHPEDAFADAFDPAGIDASRGFLSRHGVEGWLRFAAATAAVTGPAWARVSAPVVAGGIGSPPMPSLVFTHGIAMETEFTGDARNPLGALVAEGIRVIRPEGPWHGRRRLPGTYGGEPVLARGPGGLLDYFHAHAIELGRLVAWARATRGGPVCLGGVSLGALTAQLAAVAARHWPEAMRPDALFLVAPSRSLIAVTFEGSLTRALGVPQAIRGGGWTIAGIDRWRPLLDPLMEPVVPADRIVVVIGRSDDVTLTAGGEALVEAWRLPEENVFRAPAGHFSTSLGLSRDGAPFRRLLQILRG